MRTVKLYFLLRENRESGPHSLAALRTMGLRPLDLIWVDSQSTSWCYARELPELKTAIRKPEKCPVLFQSAIPATQGRSRREGRQEAFRGSPADYLRPLPPLRERPPMDRQEYIWKKKPVRRASFSPVLLVFAAALLAALV